MPQPGLLLETRIAWIGVEALDRLKLNGNLTSLDRGQKAIRPACRLAV